MNWLPFNYYTIPSFAAFIISLVLACVFYFNRIWNVNRSGEKYILRFMMLVALSSFMVFWVENLLRSGGGHFCIADKLVARQLAELTCNLIRIHWIVCLLGLICISQLIVKLAHFSDRWGKKLSIGYIAIAVLAPLFWTPYFFIPNPVPTISPPSFYYASPFLPEYSWGAKILLVISLLVVIAVFYLLIYWVRHIRLKSSYTPFEARLILSGFSSLIVFYLLDAGLMGFTDFNLSAFSSLGVIICSMILAYVLHAQRKRYVDAFFSEIANLRVTEAQMSEIFERSPIGLEIYDAAGNFIQANPASRKIFGNTYFTCQLNIFKLPVFPPDVRKQMRHYKYVNFRHELDLDQLEILIGQPLEPGGRITLDTRIAPLIWGSETEKQLGYLIQNQDVTEQATLEKQLRQAQKMEAIGQLAGGIAHDFNNLLQVILGYSELLKLDYPANPDATQMLTEIGEAGTRAKHLVEQLLTFSRKSAGPDKLEVVNVNTLLDEFQKMLSRVVGEQILLTYDPDNQIPEILIDPTQLEQVVMNLCVNARDAMPNGGALLLKTRLVELSSQDLSEFPDTKPGKYVKIIVEDSGEGMSVKTRERIFEPFFTTKPLGKGTGLGLATVYGIIQNHHGFVQVESEIDRGTIFEIFFPVNTMSTQVGEKESIPEEYAEFRGQGQWILLAEDESAVAKLGSRILEDAGFRVKVAANGAEAIDLFKKAPEKWQLVILDVVMPFVNGKQAAEQIRSTGSDIPIVFCSGYSNELLEHGDESGFIGKPFRREELLSKINSVLSS